MFLIKKCTCCMEKNGNKGCGNGNNAAAPQCTAYGTNIPGTGFGACALSSPTTGTNYDSYVSYFM